MKRQNVRTLSLVVCTFTYLLIGAAVFDALESDTESKRLEVLSDMKNGLLRKYNISAEDYHVIEIVLIENKPHKAGPQWKFAGAFYFATVVLAMIGYGHSTPVTVGGKAFCMAYAMVGIPLGLVMFQSIGERLNKFASVVIRRAKCYLRCNTTEATEMNLMFATGMLSSIIITTGAAVFSRYEGWSYFDSFYYCFVTLTTIGFGDYVALQNDQALTSKPGYVALSLVFILFGLAVVAASINLLVLRFMTMQAEENARDEDKEGSRTLLPIEGHGIAARQRSHDDQASVCSCNCLGNKQCESGALLEAPTRPYRLRARASLTQDIIERASV
ncbi:potassium channel subfamily K member 9-like [Bombyx mandarina]|uniref:Potassium channel domain-containing protein n=2 Tax=Bombyx TaxID=7090 RepID=A0A8R2HQ28_BOMMO|nr:potassium channel subfamily K member 9 [Bombyx mori]XP_021202543.2 potassium channel subfamily K member 9 [Bombyx mori]XP_028034747.1 potassium channel subfamily K member 9-like [Bombyx mandarina]XP_037876332.1 potassium channel subfamily K member 9 [Bombyx mori]